MTFGRNGDGGVLGAGRSGASREFVLGGVFSRLIFPQLMNELTNTRGFASLGLYVREKVNFHSIC